jgi:hypothetical protein
MTIGLNNECMCREKIYNYVCSEVEKVGNPVLIKLDGDGHVGPTWIRRCRELITKTCQHINQTPSISSFVGLGNAQCTEGMDLDHSNSGTVGSNPTEGMSDFLCCLALCR